MNLLLIFIAGIIGLSAGSFLNAWIWRARKGLSIVTGRSLCPECGTFLRWYDLIPVASFFLLRRSCRFCGVAISWQYVLVEAWMGLAFAGVMLLFPFNVTLVGMVDVVFIWLAVFFLTFVFVYDLQYQEIPDSASLIPAAILFIYASCAFHTTVSMLIGIVIAAGFFYAQFALSKGKWIGGGDVRFGVLMGVLLGWPSVLVGLFFSYIIGAIVSLILIAMKKKTLASQTPFGTYLSIGTLIAMIWGSSIVDWYLRISNF